MHVPFEQCFCCVFLRDAYPLWSFLSESTLWLVDIAYRYFDVDMAMQKAPFSRTQRSRIPSVDISTALESVIGRLECIRRTEGEGGDALLVLKDFYLVAADAMRIFGTQNKFACSTVEAYLSSVVVLPSRLQLSPNDAFMVARRALQFARSMAQADVESRRSRFCLPLAKWCCILQIQEASAMMMMQQPHGAVTLLREAAVVMTTGGCKASCLEAVYVRVNWLISVIADAFGSSGAQSGSTQQRPIEMLKECFFCMHDHSPARNKHVLDMVHPLLGVASSLSETIAPAGFWRPAFGENAVGMAVGRTVRHVLAQLQQHYQRMVVATTQSSLWRKSGSKAAGPASGCLPAAFSPASRPLVAVPPSTTNLKLPQVGRWRSTAHVKKESVPSIALQLLQPGSARIPRPPDGSRSLPSGRRVSSYGWQPMRPAQSQPPQRSPVRPPVVFPLPAAPPVRISETTAPSNREIPRRAMPPSPALTSAVGTAASPEARTSPQQEEVALPEEVEGTIALADVPSLQTQSPSPSLPVIVDTAASTTETSAADKEADLPSQKGGFWRKVKSFFRRPKII